MSRKRIVADRAILESIEGFTRTNGYPPSYGEICSMVGFASKGGLANRIDKLIAQGYVTVTPGKQRTIRVVKGYNANRTGVREE